MKFAIAGISGFLGTNFEKNLPPGTSIFSVPKENFRFDFPEDVLGIINFAGKAHDLKNVSDPTGYYEVNEKYSNRLYDSFLKSNAKVFITISSVKAVADSVDYPLTEDADPFPLTHYGKSKLLAEYYIKS